jgi:hypothetical protein
MEEDLIRGMRKMVEGNSVRETIKLTENECVSKEDRKVIGYIYSIGESGGYFGCCQLCSKYIFYSRDGEAVIKVIEEHLESVHELGRDRYEWTGLDKNW